MKRPINTAAVVLAAVLALTGCTPTSGASTSPVPSPSATLNLPADLTAPGAAKTVLDALVAATGSSSVVRAEVTKATASVSVLVKDEVRTWSYRDGAIKQSASELAMSEQTPFSLTGFALDNVGELFRLAGAVSGSTKDQQLQVTVYSAGKILMTVTTVPETKTVFFEPSGVLVPVLDFGTQAGITAGLADVIGATTTATSVVVSSAQGVTMDSPSTQRISVRWHRAASVPTTSVQRSDNTTGVTVFDPHRVTPQAIWGVLERTRAAGTYRYGDAWTVTVDDRERSGTPTMRFVVGGRTFTTDLFGVEITR